MEAATMRQGHVIKSPTEYLFLTHYGYMWPDINIELMVRFSKAVMIICGADGAVSEAEWAFYSNGARAFGQPEAAIEELRKFDYRNARLEDYLTGWPPGNTARAMLYMAVRTASVDGYHEKERASTAHAAKLLGVDAEMLASIEHIVETEMQLMYSKGRLIGA